MLKNRHPAFLWTLITAAVAWPAMAGAVAPRKPDLDYITPKAFAAAIVYPRSVLKSSQLEFLPVEIMSKVFKKESGLDPMEIEQAIFVVEPPNGVPPEGSPPEWAVVLKMAGPIVGEVLPALARHTTEGTLDGKTYRKAKGPEDSSIYQADERTLIIGSDGLLRKVVANHAAPAEGRLKTILSQSGTPDALGVMLVEPLRPALAALLAHAPIPPPLAILREAPKLIDSLAFKANACDSLDAMLMIRAVDDSAAEKLGGIIDDLLAMAQQAAEAGVAKQEASHDPVEQATAKYANRMSRCGAQILRPVRNGVTLTTTISPALVFTPSPAAMTAGLAAKKPDLDYITSDAVGAAIIYPQSILKRTPLAQYLPLEILSAAGKEAMGLDPVEIEQAIFVTEATKGGLPGAAIVLKMASPIAGKDVLPMLAGATVEDTLGGKTYRKGRGAMNPSIYQADERTLFVGTDAMLRKVVAAHAAPAEGKLKTMLSHCGTPDVLLLVLIEPLEPMLSGLAQGAAGVGNLGNVLKLVNYVAYKANVCDPAELAVVIRAKDEATAEQIEAIFNAAMTTQRQAVAAVIGQLALSKDPVEQALAQYGQRIAGAKDGGTAVLRKGTNLTVSGLDRSAQAGFAVGILLPAIQSAREAGRRAQSQNNLKQTVLAMHNYHSVKGAFPAQANFDAHGKPLLSWRVHILPYLDQMSLYQEFHLDEPWDSEHNHCLIAIMPMVYRNPSSRAARPGTTNYLAVCGKGLMFDGTEGRKLTDITDGSSNTIMLVEADDNRAVEWTRPQDWEFNAAQPLAGLGRAHPGGFCAAIADGSVRFLSSSIDEKMFHALLTIASGEAVPMP